MPHQQSLPTIPSPNITIAKPRRIDAEHFVSKRLDPVNYFEDTVAATIAVLIQKSPHTWVQVSQDELIELGAPLNAHEAIIAEATRQHHHFIREVANRFFLQPTFKHAHAYKILRVIHRLTVREIERNRLATQKAATTAIESALDTFLDAQWNLANLDNPENWLSALQARILNEINRTMPRTYAEDLVASAWEAVQSATTLPVPVGPETIAQPKLEEHHYEHHAHNHMTYYIGRGISRPDEWQWQPYTDIPIYSASTKNGNGRTGRIYISIRDHHGLESINDAIRHTLFQEIEKFRSGYHRNVLAALVVLANTRSVPSTTPMTIVPEHVLDVMGVQRLPPKKGEPPTWNHGHRVEDKRAVCQAILDMSQVHYQYDDIEVPVRGKFGARDLLSGSGHLLTVEVQQRKRLTSANEIVAARLNMIVALGSWISDFGETGLKQFALIAQGTMSFNTPYEAEGHVAWYLTYQFASDRSGIKQPLRRHIGTLLDVAGISLEPRKIPKRFNALMDRIADRHIIGSWEIEGDLSALPARNWLPDYRNMIVVITPPDVVDRKYEAIRNRRRKRPAAITG